jgi:predicted transcriptional regulator
MERYRRREISAVDVAVYSALCSLRREFDGVRVGQKRLAIMCGITEKTVSASVFRLYSCGLTKNVIIERNGMKYKTTVYHLQSLPGSGYFFVPRCIFRYTGVSAKMFVMYIFMCKSRHFEYEKSWNSYSDLCEKMGFNKGQRSEVVRLIGGLVKCELLKKTVRRIKGVFVDNIYRIAGFNEFSFMTEGVGCDFTALYITQKGRHFTGDYKTEKKNSRQREITTDDNIFMGVRLLS